MRVIIRAKSKCVPEYRRELLKSDDIIVEAVHGDNYWSCGLRTHNVPWTDDKDWPGKKLLGAATYGGAKRTTTARIGELGARSKPDADG